MMSKELKFNLKLNTINIIIYRFIPAPDPLGKNGPTLDNFLLFETIINQKQCPYRKKCTYGTKCKFFHPERESKKQFKTAYESVNDDILESKRQFENLKQKINEENKLIIPTFKKELVDTSNFHQSKESVKKNLPQLLLSTDKKKENQYQDVKQQILKTNNLIKPSATNSNAILANKFQNTNNLQERSINKDQKHKNKDSKLSNENIQWLLENKNPGTKHMYEPSLVVQKPYNKSNELDQDLFKRLLSRLFSETAVRKVMKNYPLEHDEDKLVFFAKEDEFNGAY